MRSKRIRQLRASYHPDRHAGDPRKQRVMQEVVRIVNTRTEPLLREDADIA